MTNNIKKNKFIENFDNQFNKQPFFEIENCNVNINDLTKENFNSKNKLSVQQKDNMDPFDYDINYINKKNFKGQQFIYYSAYNQQPGRGFGNLNVNNNIRFGEASRSDTDNFKLFRESELLDRFDFVDNMNHVSPFHSRIGNNTRKIPTQLNIPQYSQNLVPIAKPNLDQNELGQFFDYTPHNTNIINSINNNNDLLKQKQKLYMDSIQTQKNERIKISNQYTAPFIQQMKEAEEKKKNENKK